MNNGLYANFCFCGAYIPTPAKNRFGDVPEVFCSKVCETNARLDKVKNAKRVNAHRTFSKPEIKMPGMTPGDYVNQYGGSGGNV